jgi:hypothetical protein
MPYKLLKELSDDLSPWRQNKLLSELQFIKFCKMRGIPIFGVRRGDPSKLVGLGLLRNDGRGEDDDFLYHPFRAYVVHELLEKLKLPLARSAFLDKKQALATIMQLDYA